jgi:hypothetical protein
MASLYAARHESQPQVTNSHSARKLPRLVQPDTPGGGYISAWSSSSSGRASNGIDITIHPKATGISGHTSTPTKARMRIYFACGHRNLTASLETASATAAITEHITVVMIE